MLVEFKVGDNAVYPGHGVGKVAAIETKEICGNKQTFYSIKIAEVLGILKETKVKIDNQTWNRRYREYMEKIKTGSVYEIAEVLRDLYVLKAEKELSFGERKMLDNARNLLLSELTIATSKKELTDQDDVAKIFGIIQ